MSHSDDNQDDEDILGVVKLLTKIFEHTLRMAGRHGIALDEAIIEKTVKAILAKEDCWTYESDLHQVVMLMLEIPVALGAYNEPMEIFLADAVAGQIDMQRSDAEVANRRATLHVLRRPLPEDKPKRK
jgi:hypothetical protein